MDQPFDSDVMADLADEESSFTDDDAFDEYDEIDDSFDDAGYDEEDEINGFAAGGDEAFLAADELDDDFSTGLEPVVGSIEPRATFDTLDAVVADALAMDNTSQFLRQLVRGIRRIAVRVVQGEAEQPALSKPSRTATSRRAATAQRQRSANRIQAEASADPDAQSITQIARMLSDVLSSAQPDAAQVWHHLLSWTGRTQTRTIIPVIAGVALQMHLPNVARLSRSARFRLVHSTSRAIRTLVDSQGLESAGAIAPIIQSVQKIARRQQLSSQEVAIAIRRSATQVAANPKLIRRLTRAEPARSSRAGDRPTHSPAPTSQTPTVAAARAVPTEAEPVQRLVINGQELVIRGPVEIIIRSLGYPTGH